MNETERRTFVEAAFRHYRDYDFDPLRIAQGLDSPFVALLVKNYGAWCREWALIEVATLKFRQAVKKRLHTPPQRGLAEATLGAARVEECVCEIADFFATVPRKYVLHVPLEGVSSAYRGRIAIAADLWIEEFDDAQESQYWEPDLLLDEARGKFPGDLCHRLDTRHPYLCAEVSGLFAPGEDIGVAAEAFSRIKQFLFLTAVDEPRLLFGRVSEWSAKTGFVVDVDLGRAAASPITIPDPLATALAGWTFDPWGARALTTFPTYGPRRLLMQNLTES